MPDSSHPLLPKLLPRIRALVHRQLERDFRQYHPWIVPLFSTGDIVQEAVAGALTEIDRLEVEGEEAIVRYLTTVVRNRIVDAVRHVEAARRDGRRHAGRAGDETQEIAAADRRPEPALAAALAEQVQTFDLVLAEFSPRHRTLLELRLRDATPYAEIAHQLGYASAESARLAFVDAHARLLVKLRARGVRPSSETTQA